MSQHTCDKWFGQHNWTQWAVTKRLESKCGNVYRIVQERKCAICGLTQIRSADA